MFIGGYEIPRRVLALVGGVLAVAAIVVVLIVVDPFGGSSSPSATTPGTTPATTPTGTSTVQGPGPLKGQKLIVNLRGPSVVLKSYSIFVTLTKGKQTLWLQRLSKTLKSSLDSGDYIATVNFSPCKGQCSAYHGGVSLAPYHFKAGNGDITLTVTPHCTKVKYAPGIECSTSKIQRS
jgi:hypothetical protein